MTDEHCTVLYPPMEAATKMTEAQLVRVYPHEFGPGRTHRLKDWIPTLAGADVPRTLCGQRIHAGAGQVEPEIRPDGSEITCKTCRKMLGFLDPAEAPPDYGFRITRTRTKSYIGVCGLPNCGFNTNVIRMRINCVEALKFHYKKVHGFTVVREIPKELTVKDPSTTAPPRDRLADWKDHLVIFAAGKPDVIDTERGKADIVKALCWVWTDGEWKDLGEVPVFWNRVKFRLLENPADPDVPLKAQPEPMAGMLIQDGDRANSPFDLVAVGANNKDGIAAIKRWEQKYGDEPF